jgi:hypothetical protein
VVGNIVGYFSELNLELELELSRIVYIMTVVYVASTTALTYLNEEDNHR